MADENVSGPPLPVARSNKPVSEALLNEKVRAQKENPNRRCHLLFELLEKTSASIQARTLVKTTAAGRTARALLSPAQLLLSARC